MKQKKISKTRKFQGIYTGPNQESSIGNDDIIVICMSLSRNRKPTKQSSTFLIVGLGRRLKS